MKLLSCMILTAALAFGQASAELQLKAAMHKEEVEGDLKGAMEAYRKIVAQAGSNRAVAAQALYQLGECYRKQGNAEARKTFERVVKEYGDQPVAVEARARLAAMRGGEAAGNGVRVRLLWDGAVSGHGTASADGRWLSFPNWETGDVGLRDLVSGESRVVTKGGKQQGAEAESTAISPDGKRIAFAWCRWSKPAPGEYGCELRVIGADGKDERVLLDGKKYGGIVPKSWSSDSKWIVAVTGGQTLMLVPPEGAPARTLHWSQKQQLRGGAGVVISPDGKWLAFSAWDDVVSRLFVLLVDGSTTRESEAVSDAYLMGWSPDGRFLIFYRLKDDAKQLFLLPFSGGRAVGEARHFHSVYAHYNKPVGITSDGSMIFATENFPADVIVTPVDAATAVVGAPSAPVQVKVIEPAPFLGGGARFSPDGKKILYFIRPKTVLIRSLVDGSEHTTTVQLPWVVRIEWAADSNSLFAAGASSVSNRGIYRVDLTTGVATLVVDSPADFPAPSPDGNTLYYLKDRKIMARDLTTSADRLVADPFGTSRAFDVRVSHDGKMLLANGNKNLWIVDIATGQFRRLTGEQLGADWSADDRRILALVRRDACCYTGWDLASYPVDGGEPVRQPLPASPKYRGLWLSPDGKQIAMLRVDWLRQVWALDNFLPAAAEK